MVPVTSPAASPAVPLRAQLLPRAHEEHERAGYLTRASVAEIARDLRIPLAEAWEALTSYPDFHFDEPAPAGAVCGGLSCALAGLPAGAQTTGCRFRCHEAPAPGDEGPFPESAIREAGPLLAGDVAGADGLERARSLGREGALAEIDAAGLRGRGGAYFPVARKWRAALAEERPVVLVVNAEEGEPGVFKDRGILGRRPRRFLEGLAIAMEVLAPEVTVVFINGEARAARASLDAALDAEPDLLPERPLIVPGGGGYVLGEETTLLNALEGRKPVPRLRPPYPVESGLFGMPTVVNNVETIASLSVVFREGVTAFRATGTEDAPGTKLFSVSGRVERPGLYERPLGTPLRVLLESAGAADAFGALVGGPSGGLLPASEFDRPLLPGLVHETGAITGSGGVVALRDADDVRTAALAMAAYNADESCGKCTPCREGSWRALEAFEGGAADGLDDLLEVLAQASLCGLGQAAPSPIRSARNFWPELFP